MKIWKDIADHIGGGGRHKAAGCHNLIASRDKQIDSIGGIVLIPFPPLAVGDFVGKPVNKNLFA